MKRWLCCWLAAAGFALSGPAWADATPQAGTPAPDFTLPDAAGKERRLAEWRGRWLVLYFYPKDDTPGCTTEAMAFRDRQADFAALGAQVVGVSLDEAASHRAFIEKLRLPFPLLSDRDGQVARRYGALSDFGAFKFAKRRSFLIDADGRIAKAYPNVDAARHADEIIADLRALRK